MNLTELQKRLITAARINPPSDHVPYAFEKRILARLMSRPVSDEAAMWARSLWRAAVSCIAVMLLLSAWTFFAPAPTSSTGDLSQDFENTVFAAVDQEPDSTW